MCNFMTSYLTELHLPDLLIRKNREGFAEGKMVEFRHGKQKFRMLVIMKNCEIIGDRIVFPEKFTFPS